MSERTIQRVLQDNTGKWMEIFGVEGTAISVSEGQPCITIFSSIKAEELQAKIPSIVEGYPVVIKETGTFRALGEE